MKKLLKKLLLPLFAVGLIAGATVPAHAAKYTVNTLTCLPPNHTITLGFIEFLNNVQRVADERYPGMLKINHRGGTEVIAANEQTEALRTGMIDAVVTAGSYYVSVMPEIDVLSISEMMPWEERASDLFPYLDEIHRKKVNALYFGRLGSGSVFQLFTSKPISDLASIANLRIRVSPTNIAPMKAINANPIPMPNAELYTALERGVIDGFVLPPPEIIDFGLIPMVKYTLADHWYSPSNPVLFNANSWAKLPKELQDIFVEEMMKAEHVAIEQAQAKTKAALQAARDAGVVFVQLSPEEAARWKAVTDAAMMETALAKAPVEAQRIYDLSRKQ